MAENNNIDKAAKAAFDKYKMQPASRAWDRLESELDRHHSAISKHKADRTRFLFIAASIVIISLLGYYFLPHVTEIAKAKVVIVNNSPVNNKAATELSQKKVEQANNSPLNNKTAEHVIAQKHQLKTDDSKFKSVRDKNNSNTIVSLTNSEVLDSKSQIPATKKDNLNSDEANLWQQNEIVEQSLNEKEFIAADNFQLAAVMKAQIESGISIPSAIAIIPADSTHRTSSSLISKFSVALFFSPNYAWQNMKDNTNDNLDDVAMYTKRENPKFSFTTGLEFGYNLDNHWSIISGLSFTKNEIASSVPVMYVQKNTHDEMFLEYSTSNGVIEIMMHDSNNSMNPGDSISTPSDCNQYIKLLNLPLLLRYSMQRNKTSFYMEGGLTVNYVLQSKAQIMIKDKQETVINHTRGLKKYSYGFSAGIGMQQQLNSKTSLFAAPHINGYLTSLTKNTAVNTHPFSIGVNLGLVKLF
jgi:hypothetical protein